MIEIVDNLINLGNDIIKLTNNVVIMKKEISFCKDSVINVVGEITKKSEKWSQSQLHIIKQIYDIFKKIYELVNNLNTEKWIQTALEYPINYTHNCIDEYRNEIKKLLPKIGINLKVIVDSDRLKLRKEDLEDLSNKLKIELENQKIISIAKKIEIKLNELDKLIPHSSDYPTHHVQKRVEELLSRFKGINIPLDDIRIDSQIGVGGFGTVSKATRFSTAEIVAVKELRKDRITPSSWLCLYAEVRAMAAVKAHFVLELVGAHINQPYRIITRFCSGRSLFDRIHRAGADQPNLTPTQLTKIAYEIALGMNALHEAEIVHRDLKTLNILLDDNCDAFVADFGLSSTVNKNQELVGEVGTPHYTAPEILMKVKYGLKVDVYSYGVVLWEMLMKKIPYADMSPAQINEHVVTRGWRLPIPNETPYGLKKLITRCWNRNPNDRPSFIEIATQFESGNIYFPDSDIVDFKEVKLEQRCPSIDFEYAEKTLSDPKSPHFETVAFFIGAHCDKKLKKWLRSSGVMTKVANASNYANCVLLLAGVALEGDEFKQFLDKCGLTMFCECIKSQKISYVVCAVKFGLAVPENQLDRLKNYVPDLIKFIAKNPTKIAGLFLQFFNRFDKSVFNDYLFEIGSTIIAISELVEDQKTFDAISCLLEHCSGSIEKKSLRLLYPLLSNKSLSVPPSFVSTLIANEDTEAAHELVFKLLYATGHSDIDSVFLEWLKLCSAENTSIFESLLSRDDLFSTIEELLTSDRDKAALFVLFCISGIEKAQISLANSSLIGTILRIKGRDFQRLQILTRLCLSEQFCSTTHNIDGIIHLAGAALSDPENAVSAQHLIGSLSTHKTGVQFLVDYGILELVVQIFLSSPDENGAVHVIMRNVASNGGEIPQISLIISCLMQDLLRKIEQKGEILETAVALVRIMPTCVQEHDIQRIILPQLAESEDPIIVLMSLRLISATDANKLRSSHKQVLQTVCKVLENDNMMYPEIIEAALEVLGAIGKIIRLNEFAEKIELSNFVNAVQNMLGEDIKTKNRLSELLVKVYQGPVITE